MGERVRVRDIQNHRIARSVRAAKNDPGLMAKILISLL